MGRLDGKVAFITGAARGQGRSHALRLAAEGADIIACDLCQQVASVGYPMSTTDDLDETVRGVKDTGRRIVAMECDVRDADQLSAVVEAGISDFGRLDFVLANAGIMPFFGESANTLTAWQDSLDILLTGAMQTVEAAYPHLISQSNGGSVVITGSMAGVSPVMRTEHGKSLGKLGYSAAKAALENLARNYASFLAPHRVRVNVVHPTGVNTPMILNEGMADYFQNAQPEDLQVLINAIPVEAVEASDISDVMVWLCSDESKFFTGNAMRLDAGASLR